MAQKDKKAVVNEDEESHFPLSLEGRKTTTPSRNRVRNMQKLRNLHASQAPASSSSSSQAKYHKQRRSRLYRTFYRRSRASSRRRNELWKSRWIRRIGNRSISTPLKSPSESSHRSNPRESTSFEKTPRLSAPGSTNSEAEAVFFCVCVCGWSLYACEPRPDASGACVS